MDQQIGLHGTIVSIALGVAGLAAASLFDVRAADQPFHALLWVLWGASLLGVGVVYSGMTVAVYALPSTIPSALDMFLPFAVGLTEFMLFAVLTTPLTVQLGPRSIVALWLSCLCLFGCFASAAIQRIRWLFEHTDYNPPTAQRAVCDVAALMRRDAQGASHTAVAAAIGAMMIGLFQAVPLDLSYFLVFTIMCGMGYGLYNQHLQAQILETEISRLSADTDTEAAAPFGWFSRSAKP